MDSNRVSLLNWEDEFRYYLLKEAKKNINQNSDQNLDINSKESGIRIDFHFLHDTASKYDSFKFNPYGNFEGTEITYRPLLTTHAILETWNSKLMATKKLKNYCAELIEIINVYIDKRQENEELATAYKQTYNEIEKLINQEIQSPKLKFSYKELPNQLLVKTTKEENEKIQLIINNILNDIEILLKIYNGQIEPKITLEKQRTNNKGRKIEILEIVEKNENESMFNIVINKDCLTEIRMNTDKPTGKLLYKLASGQAVSCPYPGDKIINNSLDYLNSNKNCQLYTKTGCTLTKILKIEGGVIKPVIKLESISKKKFTQRRNAEK